MKKIIYSLILSVVFLGFYACEDDNYDMPDETFRGKIIDKDTGETLQTEIGGNGIRIRMMEYSWSDNPQPYDFYCMMDGTFNNTKIFKGSYGIIPAGAFVPVPETQPVEIKGVREIDFEVEPFLRIQWIGEPVVNANGTITVKARITRGTTNASYQKNLTDIYLYVNEIPYVGNMSYDSKYTPSQTFSGATGNVALGQELSMTTKGALIANRTYYIRVGARIDQTIEGVKRFNYSTVKEVKVP
ncbi:hypothetical protein FACS1894203_2270 [Bacteroidia bacterium]|nr:hypothetical protein FACS1894203_2270 [Bacteroidia bacterium]GHT70734.1 hypothetical protein FACS189455_1010 [Bacteroidia bacterium]